MHRFLLDLTARTPAALPHRIVVANLFIQCDQKKVTPQTIELRAFYLCHATIRKLPVRFGGLPDRQPPPAPIRFRVTAPPSALELDRAGKSNIQRLIWRADPGSQRFLSAEKCNVATTGRTALFHFRACPRSSQAIFTRNFPPPGRHAPRQRSADN